MTCTYGELRAGDLILSPDGRHDRLVIAAAPVDEGYILRRTGGRPRPANERHARITYLTLGTARPEVPTFSYVHRARDAVGREVVR